MSKFYLVTDNSVQWFSAILKTKEDGIEVVECKLLDNLVRGPFLSNIFGREIHFGNRKFTGAIDGNVNPSYGWSISEDEYNKICRLIDLSVYVAEFNKLIQ